MAISSIEKKHLKLEKLIASMVVDTIGDRTFAILKSSTNANVEYEVTIDESGKLKKVPYAVDCTCEGHVKYHKYCSHMEAVDVFYVRLVSGWPVAESVTTSEEATTEVKNKPVPIIGTTVPQVEEVTITDEEIEAVLAEIDALDNPVVTPSPVPVVNKATQTNNKTSNQVKGSLYRPVFTLPKSYKQMEEEKLLREAS